MEYIESTDEFNVEDVETTIKSAIGMVLSDTMYTSNKVSEWSNSILSNTLKGLQSLNQQFKFAISVIIMQKNGAGLVTTASTFWDVDKDGLCKVVWENTTTIAIVTCYGLCLNIDSKDED
jgi:dynein light chain Tctex-type 1